MPPYIIPGHRNALAAGLCPNVTGEAYSTLLDILAELEELLHGMKENRQKAIRTDGRNGRESKRSR